MPRNGLKPSKGTNASHGDRSRRERRRPAEENEDPLRYPHPLVQGATGDRSFASSLLPHDGAAIGVSEEESSVHYQLHSNSLAQDGRAADVLAYPYTPTQGAPRDDAPIYDQLHTYSPSQGTQVYSDVFAQGILEEGASALDQRSASVPRQRETTNNPYHCQDTYTPTSLGQHSMVAFMPDTSSSGPGIGEAAANPYSFRLDDQVRQPLGSQDQGLQDLDITNWDQGIMNEAIEGLQRCSGLGAPYELSDGIPQGVGSALPRQALGSPAQTTRAENSDVIPQPKQRRGREKKPKLYELGPQENEEDEMKRLRAIRQKELRDKDRKRQQEEEAVLQSVYQQIDALHLEIEQRGQVVRRLEAEVASRNLFQGSGTELVSREQATKSDDENEEKLLEGNENETKGDDDVAEE